MPHLLLGEGVDHVVLEGHAADPAVAFDGHTFCRLCYRNGDGTCTYTGTHKWDSPALISQLALHWAIAIMPFDVKILWITGIIVEQTRGGCARCGSPSENVDSADGCAAIAGAAVRARFCPPLAGKFAAVDNGRRCL